MIRLWAIFKWFVMNWWSARSHLVTFSSKKILTSNGCKPIRLLSKISVYQYVYIHTLNYNIEKKTTKFRFYPSTSRFIIIFKKIDFAIWYTILINFSNKIQGSTLSFFFMLIEKKVPLNFSFSDCVQIQIFVLNHKGITLGFLLKRLTQPF